MHRAATTPTTQAPARARTGGRALAVAGRRWPTLLALAAAGALWGVDTTTAGQLLPVLPLVYVAVVVARRPRTTWPVLLLASTVFGVLQAQDAVDPLVGVTAVASAVAVAGALRAGPDDRSGLVRQVVGFLVFTGVAAAGLAAAPDVARGVLAVGWLGQGGGGPPPPEAAGGRLPVLRRVVRGGRRPRGRSVGPPAMRTASPRAAVQRPDDGPVQGTALTAGRQVSRVGRARLVVLALLVTNVTWAVVLPVALTAPPSAPARALVGSVAAVVAVAFVLVVRAAVTPWTEDRTRYRLLALLVTAALALGLAASAWPARGQEPSAWLAGTVVGVLPLVLHPRAALGLGAALIAVTAAGALVRDQSVGQTLGFAVGTAVLVLTMAQVLVWMLRLLVAAEAGRTAEAGLAVSDERLRMAQELHDLLGHRLTVIALRAELAGDLAASDPVRARAEADAVRELASSTLREARSAVHGYGTVDLAEQLRTAELVLASAGVRTDVRVGASAAHEHRPPPGHQLDLAATLSPEVSGLVETWFRLSPTACEVLTVEVQRLAPPPAPRRRGPGVGQPWRSP